MTINSEHSGQAEYYLSKLVDIDPPQLLSNLSTEQEITIGLGISDIIREDQEPMCYWYDSTGQCLAWGGGGGGGGWGVQPEIEKRSFYRWYF